MINVSDLKKRLSVEILPVYFLKGQDAYVKELAIGVLKGLLDKDFADMNLTVFEDSSDMAAVVQTLNTVPVFDERRLVVVKSSEGLDDAGRAKLEAYLNNPSGFSVLAFSDDAIARDDFPKKRAPFLSCTEKARSSTSAARTKGNIPVLSKTKSPKETARSKTRR